MNFFDAFYEMTCYLRKHIHFTLKQARAIYTVMLLTGLLALILGNILSVAIAVVGGIVVLVALVFYVVFFRCPHCEERLHIPRYWTKNYEYCPRCGKKIN